MNKERPSLQSKLPVIFLISLLPIANLKSQSIPSIKDIHLDSATIEVLSNEIVSGIRSHNQFVCWAAIGQAFSLAHRYEESNRWFEKAYLLKTDEKSSSQKSKEESYDELYQVSMVLYFKAINYLELGDVDNALVECRRLDEWMRPRSPHDLARKILSEDPLIQSLMGIIFEIDNDYSDSWLSYNKARQIFETDYKDLLGKHVPGQLIKNEVEMDSMAAVCDQAIICQEKPSYGKLIFFWHNGLSPKKEITGPDFKIKSCGDSWYTNTMNNYTVTDNVGNTLLPFYKFTRPLYSFAELTKDGQKVKCELLEDITWFSVWTLQERLHSDGIHVWRRGTNWSTLPSTVYYAIIRLAPGANKFEFNARGAHNTSASESFTIMGDGRSHFHIISTLASVPISLAPYASQQLNGIDAYGRR